MRLLASLAVAQKPSLIDSRFWNKSRALNNSLKSCPRPISSFTLAMLKSLTRLFLCQQFAIMILTRQWGSLSQTDSQKWSIRTTQPLTRWKEPKRSKAPRVKIPSSHFKDVMYSQEPTLLTIYAPAGRSPWWPLSTIQLAMVIHHRKAPCTTLAVDLISTSRRCLMWVPSLKLTTVRRTSLSSGLEESLVCLTPLKLVTASRSMATLWTPGSLESITSLPLINLIYHRSHWVALRSSVRSLLSLKPLSRDTWRATPRFTQPCWSWPTAQSTTCLRPRT